MIPKKLHYCWFGSKQKPDVFVQCLESWKQHCSEYQLIEWNETNAARYSCSFYKQAQHKKAYAFMADYVRVCALEEMGGFYLDTDMLLVKPLDTLAEQDFVIGEEVPGRINFALFGAEPGQQILKEMKAQYHGMYYNPYSPPVISHQFSELIFNHAANGSIKVQPPELFYPMPYQERESDPMDFVTERTVAVHLWDHSWGSKRRETAWTLVKDIIIVIIDYLFHAYPYAYLKRYVRGFGRKLWHRIIGKKK